MNEPRTIEAEGAPSGRLSIRTVAMPADTNPRGHIFGGWLLSQMDVAGGTHAHQRARGKVATIAVESMTFHKPVFVGDEVSCYTHIVKVGVTSIAVRVEAWVRRHDAMDEGQIRVTSAVFTYVALDGDNNKRKIPD